MNGMEMMFKSIMGAAGFDAEKFKGDVEKGLADARAKYAEVKAQQDRIEAKLDALLENSSLTQQAGANMYLIHGGQSDG